MIFDFWYILILPLVIVLLSTTIKFALSNPIYQHCYEINA